MSALSAQKDGGPAFPETRWDDIHRRDVIWQGMTIRDYFAAKALAGSLASQTAESHWAFAALPHDTEPESKAKAGIAQLCYELADAMLAEREKGAQS